MSEKLTQLRKDLKYEKTNQCVQCGYCLPVCPTYVTMKKETHSPRGRINLIKMVGEGRIDDLSVLQEPIDLCLGCRACETACPTGVEYGTLLEAAKATLQKEKKHSLPAKLIQKTLFKKVFPSRSAMQWIGNSMWIYEKSGLRKVVQKSGILKALPYNLDQFEAITPPSVSPSKRAELPREQEAKGATKYKVAFFVGCIMDAMFHRINELSIKLLAEVGCEVHVVRNQTCCGALHAHAGELDDSKELAKRNIAAFEQEKVDFIVNNAGGCGAMLLEYDHLLADEPKWVERAKAFSNKTKDISQVLSLCGGLQVDDHPHETVTYQRSCHMTNVQKVTKEPVQLLKSIPNVRFVEMNQADMCCGSAGIYNIVHYDESMTILDEKMENVKATEATTIITTNPGCLLQMKLGVEREKLSHHVRALHLVEYLAEAVGIK